MNPRIFREYDVRGVAERDLDDTTVHAIGVAIGARVPGETVVVGRDPRVHSPRLFTALTDGIRAHADVIDIGLVATPMLYFAAHELEPAAAVEHLHAALELGDNAGDGERSALGLHHLHVRMGLVERQQVGGTEADAEEFRCVLYPHGAIDGIGDGAAGHAPDARGVASLVGRGG